MDALRQSIEATKKGERPAEAKAGSDGRRGTSRGGKRATKTKASTRRSTQRGRKLKKVS
jgi:hypothetical protein